MIICNISLLVTPLLMLNVVAPINHSTQMTTQTTPNVSVVIAQTYQPPDRDLPGRREGGGTR